MGFSTDPPDKDVLKPRLPLSPEFVPMLSETMIQIQGMIAATQESLAENRALEAREASSPLNIPEKQLGSIVSSTT